VEESQVPQQRFPLRSGGPRQIALRWSSPRRDLRIEFDGTLLCEYAECEDLVDGARIELGRSAYLDVWWVEATTSFRVQVNGIVVRGGSEVHPDIADAAPMVFAIGVFNLVAGQLAVLLYGPTSLDVVASGALLLGLGALVRQGSKRALGIAIAVLGVSLAYKVALMFGDGPKMVPLATVLIQLALASAMIRSYVLASTEW